MTIHFSVFSNNRSYLNNLDTITENLDFDESLSEKDKIELDRYLGYINETLYGFDVDNNYLKNTSNLFSFAFDTGYEVFRSPVYNVSATNYGHIDMPHDIGLEEAKQLNNKKDDSSQLFNYTQSEKLNDYFYNVTNNDPHFLNPGFISCTKNIVVFETPPSYKLIQYYNYTRENINEENCNDILTVRIPVPWQVYVAIHDGSYKLIDTYMFFARESILNTDFNQTVYLPYLLNFYTNSQLCRPFYSDYSDVSRYPTNINGLMHSAYDSVWNSGWNFDLFDCVAEFRMSVFRNGSMQAVLEYLQEKSPERHSLFANAYTAFQTTHQVYSIRMFSALCEMLSILTPEEALMLPMSTPSYHKIMDVEVDYYRTESWQNFIENGDYDSDSAEDEEYMNEMFNEFLESNSYSNPRKDLRSLEKVVSNIFQEYRESFKQIASSGGLVSNNKNYTQMMNYFISKMS